MLSHMFFAMVAPSRRIPAPMYAALQILVAAPAAVAYIQVCQLAENSPSALQATVIVLMWFNFCILANRFHDGGLSGLWHVPLFVLGLLIYLAELDPVMLGTDWATHDLWSGRVETAKRVFALLACATAAMAMVIQTSHGRNRYGMPMGEKDWTRQVHFSVDATHGQAGTKVARRHTSPSDGATQTRTIRESLKSGRAKTFLGR